MFGRPINGLAQHLFCFLRSELNDIGLGFNVLNLRIFPKIITPLQRFLTPETHYL